VKSTEKQATSWEDLPEDIKNTYDRLGIPEAEKQRLVAGVAAQYESEVVYHQIREDLEEKGVIFVDTDTGLREHEDLFREYFTSVIPPGDNKFAALNTAVWSGGSFIYVPPGVHVDIPLQAYFRINTENMGQFERTLIIADEGSYVHYVEGCTAPIYKSDSCTRPSSRSSSRRTPACATRPSRTGRTTSTTSSPSGHLRRGRDDGVDRRQHRLQGDDEVPRRLPPRRARQGRDALDRLRRRGPAPGRRLQDGPRGPEHEQLDRLQVGGPRRRPHVLPRPRPDPRGRDGQQETVVCDALLVDTISRSDTYPYVDIREDDVQMGHEATVSKVSEDQMFYLMSRGMSEEEAMAMIVRGFVEPIAKELPMEYALELNRLIELQMEGAVG
jgi:Fe-S cluster assembly protein SufB